MWSIIRRRRLPGSFCRHPIFVIGTVCRSNDPCRNVHNSSSLLLQSNSSPSSSLSSSRTSSRKQATSTSSVVATKDPDNWRSQLLYVDSSLCILNKRPGIAVHTGTNQQRNNLSTLMSSLEQYLQQQHNQNADPNRKHNGNSSSTSLRLVHRLDKETSGCLMLARNRQTAQVLSELLKREGSDDLIENDDAKPRGNRKQSKQAVVHTIQHNIHQTQQLHQDPPSSIHSYSPVVWSTPPFVNSEKADSGVQKRYLAIVHGVPERKEGSITSIISADGKQAVSSYRTLASVSFVPGTTVGGSLDASVFASKSSTVASSPPVAFSLLQLLPHTGRKRQLRLHCFHDLQCSIVGEKLSHVVGDSDINSATNNSGKGPSIVWTKSHSLRQERMQHVESQLWKFVHDQGRDSSVFQSTFISPPATNHTSSLPLLLHAHELFVLHPKLNEGRIIHATAPLPRNFYRAVKALFGEDAIPTTEHNSNLVS